MGDPSRSYFEQAAMWSGDHPAAVPILEAVQALIPDDEILDVAGRCSTREEGAERRRETRAALGQEPVEVIIVHFFYLIRHSIRELRVAYSFLISFCADLSSLAFSYLRNSVSEMKFILTEGLRAFLIAISALADIPFV